MRKMFRAMLMRAAVAAVLLGALVAAQVSAQGEPSIKVISPQPGDKITTTDIAVQVEVSDFNLSAQSIGLPDAEGQGHIHVMLDSPSMGALFNMYATDTFTLPGTAVEPGEHTLIFVLATNTHGALMDSVQMVKIDYQPDTAKSSPAPASEPGDVALKIVSPEAGATVGPRFTVQVEPANFTPSLELEGKPNLAGFGHYHVWVDPDMANMSMAGMVAMPGGNSIDLDLSAWAPGQHTIVVMAFQNDHSMLAGAMPAMLMVNVQDLAAEALPRTGGAPIGTALPVAIGIAFLLVAGGLGLRRLRVGSR